MPKQEKNQPSRVRVRMSRVWAHAGKIHKPGDVVEVSPQASKSLLNDRAATLVDPAPVETATAGPDAGAKAGVGSTPDQAASKADAERAEADAKAKAGSQQK